MKALRVNSPFGSYAVGALITDAAEVARVMSAYPRRFYTPTMAPDDHPAVAAPASKAQTPAKEG